MLPLPHEIDEKVTKYSKYLLTSLDASFKNCVVKTLLLYTVWKFDTVWFSNIPSLKTYIVKNKHKTLLLQCFNIVLYKSYPG